MRAPDLLLFLRSDGFASFLCPASAIMLESPIPALLDNRQRMRFAQLAQGTRGAVALVVLASYGLQYQLLHRMQLGEIIGPEAADANDWRVRVLVGVQFVVALLAFIALVQWFHRAYQNAHRLPRARPEYRASMAVWGWLIPIINLWYPYKIMLELGHYLGGFTNPRNTIVSSRWDFLVVGWWVLYIGVVIISRVNVSAVLNSSGADSLDGLLRTTRLLMATQALTIASAAVTVALLRTIAPHEQSLTPVAQG